MIIECKKRAVGYKPVKGNEKEIINHLLDNYGECYVAKDEEVVSFNDSNKTFFINDETTFFKCEKDGRIHIAKDKYTFKNYVAVPFNTNNDLMRVFTAPNFESFKRDGTRQLVWKSWILKTTTETFAISYGDIIIFNECWEIVDCLMNVQNKKYESLLTCNDYMVKRDD